MPIFEYQCKECNKKFEVLQKNSTPYTECNEVNSSCEKHSPIQKIISSFAFSMGSTGASSEMYCEPSSGPVGGGCGCHGTGSCPGASMAEKYGLN